MVYSTSRCPSCGKVIRRQTNPVHEVGDPFERCQWCGTIYRNSYKEEWITKSPLKRFFFFLQAGVWARAFIVPILLLIIPMSAFDMSAEAVWVIWPVLGIAWLVMGYFVHKKSERDDILKSVERTKDPEYIKILKKAGYTIYPIEAEYLSPNNQYTAQQTVQPTPATSNNICYCRKCGNKLISDSLFCDKCGTKISGNKDD